MLTPDEKFILLDMIQDYSDSLTLSGLSLIEYNKFIDQLKNKLKLNDR